MKPSDEVVAGNGRPAERDGEQSDKATEPEGQEPRSPGTGRDVARGWDETATRAAHRVRDLAATDGDDCAFLAEASRLLADSLDYETTLATVAGLALPQLGAWCFVDVIAADGGLRRLAVVHPDPDKQELARRLETHWPPERSDPMGAPRAMDTRKAELIPEVTEAMLRQVARGPDNLRMLKELGMGSLMVVPLLARGEVLGAVTFVSPARGPTYTAADLELAEDLAARSAIALDNARLYRMAEEARRDAETANEAKSVFLAMMSHEVRTPINAIIGYAELLEMQLQGELSDGQLEQVERIQASSRHLLGLVNEVLDLAKVEAGQMTVRRERRPASEAVLGALRLVAPQAEEHQIEVVNEAESHGEVYYRGDEDRVRQILTNLLSNAVKFTLPDGRIVVRSGVTHDADAATRVAGEGPWVYVDVVDTGIGIADADQTAVFEPFKQVRSGHTREVGGTGLGLTVSRQLARLMGGDLTVRSELGEGSTFTLWLPSTGPVVAMKERGRPRGPEPGMMRAGWAILSRLDGLVRDYVDRLESESVAPVQSLQSAAVLRGHIGTLLADIGQSLLVLAEGGDDHSQLLRHGGKIQRLIAELHGGQRQRLGWTLEATRREFEILRAVVRRTVIAAEATGEHDGGELSAIDRFLDQAERISRQGMQAMAAAQAL